MRARGRDESAVCGPHRPGRHLMAGPPRRQTLAAVIVAGMFILNACGSDTTTTAGLAPAGFDPQWGPLAVIRSVDGSDDASIEGSLRITDECVLLEEETGREVLLLWPSNSTAWDWQTLAVRFESERRDGKPPVKLGDGQGVRISGSGAVDAEGDPWAISGSVVEWVASPADPCVRGTWFAVESVEALDP